MDSKKVLDGLKRRFPNEPEYHQAVSEVLESIEEVYNSHPEFEDCNLIERICIPDRIVSFRVTWTDDYGRVQTNMGYRVQHNCAIGPYKGGIRFHASVNQSILKFLAFEQTFKNALTTLPMGGAKGGSDFNPKGKSDDEIMRFCQAFILELWRHIGPETDVPAGDIGVGGREVGYMFGMYKKLAREHTGTFTGKGITFGGSLMRPEATGYGNVYFLQQMLATKGIALEGKTVCISGSGNVAQYTAEKLISLGAKVVTMSDSNGYIYDPDGISREKLDYIMHLKNVERGRIREYSVGREMRHRHAECHTERDQRRGSKDASRERMLCRIRRSQHAFHTGSHRCLPERKNSLCTGEGGQCRRRVRIRARNDPEFPETQLEQ